MNKSTVKKRVTKRIRYYAPKNRSIDRCLMYDWVYLPSA